MPPLMNWAKSRSTASKFEKQMRYSISWAVNTIQNGFGRAENVCPKQLSSLKPCWVAFDNITLLFSAWVTTSAVARCPRLQRRQSSHKVADTEAKVLWHHRLDVWVKQNSGSFSSTLKRRVAGPTPLDLKGCRALVFYTPPKDQSKDAVSPTLRRNPLQKEAFRARWSLGRTHKSYILGMFPCQLL